MKLQLRGATTNYKFNGADELTAVAATPSLAN